MGRKTTCAVCLVPALSIGVPAAPGQTLWAYYPINENDFKDYSGSNHHGTPVDGAATVTDPAVVTLSKGTEWKIPLSDFAGVSLTRIKRITIGIGDKSKSGGRERRRLDRVENSALELHRRESGQGQEAVRRRWGSQDPGGGWQRSHLYRRPPCDQALMSAARSQAPSRQA